MDGFPVFWLPHTGSQSSVIHHAVPLSCHMDGWDREQPERLKPALLCITFCLCTYSHCTLSPLTPIPASLDRETDQQAEMLIVPLGPLLILPITSFTALSMLTPTSIPAGPDPDQFAFGWLHVWLSACSTESAWREQSTHLCTHIYIETNTQAWRESAHTHTQMDH